MAKIMTVDDADSIRTMVTVILESQGHQVIQARTGGEALTLARKESVDLVLADLNMPGMSGIGLVSKLRMLDHYQNTPILMLTTETDPYKKNKARNFGANGWIAKPVTEERLLKAVGSVLAV